MKKAICVNVDVDTWIIAKTKVENISDYLNECLKGLTGNSTSELKREDIQEKIKSINSSINDLHIKKSILEVDLKSIEEHIQEQERIRKESEQYKRWKCPVCKINNYIDVVRCSNCNLLSRNDKNTLIIDIRQEDLSNA